MRWLLYFASDDPSNGVLTAWMRRAMAGFGLALLGATWRMWTPQHVFPQVPLLRAALTVPAWCQWVGVAAMVLGLLGALVAPAAGARPGRAARWALLTFAFAAAAMIVLDQQRLQPWAYQFILIALVLALVEAREALALVRLLVISFYAYSALTKFDASFLHTLGQQFLAALVGIGGASVESWSDTARLAGAAIFPAGEMLVALGLCFARTRRAALAGAVLLHALLLLILGPWGLDHKPGVLLWNAFFIVQDVLLFWQRPAAQSAESPRRELSLPLPVPRSVQAIVAAALVLPILAPSGWFDIWPSWGLYASCSQRVRLLVHRRALDDVSPQLRPFVEEPAETQDPWLVVRIDRWALAALGAPIYPQNRTQLGVAQAVIHRDQLMERARILRFSMADRITSRRTYDQLDSQAEIAAAGGSYFFNWQPRGGLFRSHPARNESE